MGFRESPNRCRILQIGIRRLYQRIISIATIGMYILGLLTHRSSLGMVFLTDCHLRVIRRWGFVKHHNVLMFPEWHFLGIKKTAFEYLIPNDIVTVELGIRKHHGCGKLILAEQKDRAIRFDDPFVLLPQQSRRDNCIPLVLSSAVGQIA